MGLKFRCVLISDRQTAEIFFLFGGFYFKKEVNEQTNTVIHQEVQSIYFFQEE